MEAAFSPGRAEQALSEKKGLQTNKPAGFVCEQTVNCDGASFNLQIHLSTERQQQIDRADQKNEYLFQGLTRHPQDTGYLATYSVNIQRWLAQLSQGICSQLSPRLFLRLFLSCAIQLFAPCPWLSQAQRPQQSRYLGWEGGLVLPAPSGQRRTLILTIRKSRLMSPHLR